MDMFVLTYTILLLWPLTCHNYIFISLSEPPCLKKYLFAKSNHVRTWWDQRVEIRKVWARLLVIFSCASYNIRACQYSSNVLFSSCQYFITKKTCVTVWESHDSANIQTRQDTGYIKWPIPCAWSFSQSFPQVSRLFRSRCIMLYNVEKGMGEILTWTLQLSERPKSIIEAKSGRKIF